MVTENGDYLLTLRDRARVYAATMKSKRHELATPEFWYPYGSISNFDYIEMLLTGANRNVFREINPKRAADIGAADGDVSFFLEQEGWDMTIIDNPPTNWNGLKGAKLFREAMGSNVRIEEMDLDSQFILSETYELVFMMGILYHLKNPFYILEHLSKSAKYAIISTRIMRWSGPAEQQTTGSHPLRDRQLMEHLPVAYLLGPNECNNDSTNYWIFSDAGLRRLLDRAQWDIKDYRIFGDTNEADPFSAKHDARAFCLVQSRRPSL
jgi:tRNA (mo5U34)-methyltransferase